MDKLKTYCLFTGKEIIPPDLSTWTPAKKGWLDDRKHNHPWVVLDYNVDARGSSPEQDRRDLPAEVLHEHAITHWRVAPMDGDGVLESWETHIVACKERLLRKAEEDRQYAINQLLVEEEAIHETIATAPLRLADIRAELAALNNQGD